MFAYLIRVGHAAAPDLGPVLDVQMSGHPCRTAERKLGSMYA